MSKELKPEVKKILVTGGGGYIGAELCKSLLKAGYKVSVLDIFLYGVEVFSEIKDSPNLEIIRGDIREKELLEKAMSGVYCVVHLAAIVGAPESNRIPDVTWSINLDGTKSVYETALKAGVKKLIFASTVSNYGAVGTDVAVDEDSALDPISPYSESKVEAEEYLKSKAREQKDLAITILRLATVYGISDRMRFDLLLNEFVRDAYFKKIIDVFGDQGRTFVHVKDVARAILKMIDLAPEIIHCQIFNVGDDRFSNMTKFEVGKLVAETVGDVKFNPVDKVIDNRNYKVSFKKIKEMLGFECSVFPEEGIKEIVMHFEQHPDSDYYSTRFTNLEKYLDLK